MDAGYSVMKTTLRALLVFLFLTDISFAEVWKEPHVLGAMSASADYVVRIIPGVDSKNIKAEATTFKFHGGIYEIQKKWFVENTVSPVLVYISDNGNLVTVDNWYEAGYGKVVTVYDPKGSKVVSYELKDLYGNEQLKKLENPSVSIHWVCYGETPEVSEENLKIWDVFGGRHEINLSDGKKKYIPNDLTCPDYK